MQEVDIEKASFYLEPPEIKGANSKSVIWVGRTDFYCRDEKINSDEPYLLLGFDTEFKTPPTALTRDQIKQGKATYTVLSYQFHAKLCSPKGEALTWQGIHCPLNGQRLSIKEFIIFALGLGARNFDIKKLPTKIYLVGHFTRADVPAFSDFREHLQELNNLRNTFVNTDKPISLDFFENTGSSESIKISLFLRDTMLLTPQASKSLKALGQLVGVPKINLSENRAEQKHLIANMDKLRHENWPLFEKYALNDALICLRYIEEIIALYEVLTGKHKVPITLTSIGIDLLITNWAKRGHKNYLELVGKEQIEDRYFNKRLNRMIKSKKDVSIDVVHHSSDFINETYHGGRNEQFWFGPCFEDTWTDYDLSGAYPTAMALIKKPLWKELKHTKSLNDFKATTLGFAHVEFKFNKSVRYPSLPVRTPFGLIFPLEGESYCSSPEIVVALSLGAKIKIKEGVVIPTDSNFYVFREFITECIQNRNTEAKNNKKSLKALFWKEISNSSYGKTAQGLREKRVYDLRDQDTKILPPSKITNPVYASFITSFIRALLAEVMNSLPSDSMVFSCTTDGFLTNAKATDIEISAKGELAKIFIESRLNLVNKREFLEVKHQINKPLGWKTRGQATLIAGSPQDDGSHIVLAKGGIRIQEGLETVEDQNEEIIKLFFDRTPNHKIPIETLTGMRDIVERKADLVSKVFDKQLNMEYDWKRQPKSIGMSGEYNHVFFSTRPWVSTNQFLSIRDGIESFYANDNFLCVKDIDTFNLLANHIETTSGLSKESAKYLHKKDGDLKRLRQAVCSAWTQSKAGFSIDDRSISYQVFAEYLTDIGIPCKKADVENAKKKEFTPHIVPPTVRVKNLMYILRRDFPSIKVKDFLDVNSCLNAIRINNFSNCNFTKLVK